MDGVSVINVYRRGAGYVYMYRRSGGQCASYRTPRLGGYQWACFLAAASIVSMLACGVAILHVVNAAQEYCPDRSPFLTDLQHLMRPDSSKMEAIPRCYQRRGTISAGCKQGDGHIFVDFAVECSGRDAEKLARCW